MEFALNETTVTLLVSLVLPFVTGFVTKASASTTLKQVVSLVVSGVTVLLLDATVGDGGALITEENFVMFLVSTGTQVLSYLGFYKPHNVNQQLAPEFGLGAAA